MRIDCLCSLKKKTSTATAAVILFPKSVKSQYCSYKGFFFYVWLSSCLLFLRSTQVNPQEDLHREHFMSSQRRLQLSATDNVVLSSLPRQLNTYPRLNDSETQSSHDLSDPGSATPSKEKKPFWWEVKSKNSSKPSCLHSGLWYTQGLVEWKSPFTHS